MPRKMLINALHEEEARVAIVEDGQLVDLDIEIAGREQTRGNIYKAVVVRVEPGLQAAFIDIGLKKLAFIQMGDLHPDCWKWRDDVPEGNRTRRPRIQEILRRGQELVVQVEKGERETKGAAVTTYISLPGRYMVLMPGDDSAGISRKVESEAERKKLKEKVAELEIPPGIGYILRTEAVGKTKTELAKDLKFLIKLYEEIRAKGAQAKGPALIYQESSLVIRTIRDYFTADIDEVLVDSKEVYKQAREFFKETMPKYEKLVKLHQERRPIFSRYQLEEQIDLIYEKKVPLKSGGSIFIEPTEALVSIDVNSGKSTGEKGVEDTAFKSNMEAAEEAARQLRLRDLGGLIVIDFIDMRDKKHIAEVEKTLKNALKADKARVTVGRISQFGLLEMSRQRIRQTLNEAIYLVCPHCEGRGKLKSVEAMALSFLRKVHAAAAKGTAAEVRGGLPLEVAYYLLNRKKRELAQIETDYDIEVTVKGKPSFTMNQLELEIVRRERPLEPHAEPVRPVVAADVAVAEAPAAVAEPSAEEGKGKRSRRRKKGEEPPVPVVAPAEEAELEAAAEEPLEDEAPAEGEGQEEGRKRKRRRRRKRKGGGEAGLEAPAAGEETSGEAPAEEPEAATGEEPETAEQEAGAEGGRKKRRRKRKRKGAAAEPEEAGIAALPEETEAAGEAAAEHAEGAGEEPVEEGEVSPEGAKKKKRRRKRKRKPSEQAEGGGAVEAEAPAAAPEAPESAPEPAAPAAEKPAAKPRRRKTPSAEAAVPAVEPAPVEVPAPAAAAEPAAKPAKPRRVKKPAPAAEAPAPATVESAPEAPVEKPAAKPGRSRKKSAAPAETAAPAVPQAESIPAAAGEEKPKKPARAKRPAAAKAAPEAQPAPEPTPAVEAENPKKTRAPRKKKEEQGS